MDKTTIKDRNSQYFKILKFNDMYLMYYNNIVKWRTYITVGTDGINFNNFSVVLSKSNACHNFSPFVEGDKIIAIAGQDDWKSRLQEKKKKSHNKGLYLFESSDGLCFDEKKLIIKADHPGFISSLEWKSAEFDSYLSIVKKNDLYYLYLRANIAPGMRFIQYSTSKDLINWGEFKLINMDKKLNGNYYFANVEIVGDKFYMFAPYFTGKMSCIKIYSSNDGENFKFIKDILNEKPSMIRDRNKKKKNLEINYVPKSKVHPVGIIDDSFYYHNNYRGYVTSEPVTVERISLNEIL